ncbi:hypothetical protein NL380_28915, partial [Klebsiella pneumoniae]|nr:hypothetical protein [Klebsiella pneumoniae]
CGGDGDGPNEVEDGADDEAQAADGEDGGDGDDSPSGEVFAVAELTDAADNDVGTVEFSDVDGGVRVEVDVESFEAGF